MKKRICLGHLGLVAFGALGLGCAGLDQANDPQGNAALGIAEFDVVESDVKTTVVGLDASGQEVGRLEIVHGRFALSPPFTEDYETPDVDGRKLTAKVIGDTLHWETAGYEPVLEMPAHPASKWALAAFLDDPHAKSVLDRWQIGFEPFQSDERAYASGIYNGDSPENCNGSSTCGSAYYGTINTCGGGGSPTNASRVTQRSGSNCGLYSSSYNQVRVAQCCPAGSGGQSGDWYATKTCPTTSNNSTSCGTRTSGACKGCGAYNAPTDCFVGTDFWIGECAGDTVYELSYDYY